MLTRIQIGTHLRRLAVVLLSVLSRTWVPFVLIGAFNRCFPFFTSVFFCYAGDNRYAKYYSYPSCRTFLLWFPSTIGVFRQGRRWGLICAAPVTEEEFTNPNNAADLRRLLGRLVRIKWLLGVQQLSFAGILPSVLHRKWPQIIPEAGAIPTCEMVRKAVHEVRKEHFSGRDHNVVLFGGAGRIGLALHNFLKADGVEVFVVDSSLPASPKFEDFGSASMLLVDVSRHGAIQRHIQELPTGTVVLNEVFPEPSSEAVRGFKSRNIAAYHIAGVRADVYPSLPLGYSGALPCCAIHSADLGEPILRRIA